MPVASSKQSAIVPVLDYFFLFGGFITLFFIFTNGIPLIQLGLFPELEKKNKYTVLTHTILLIYTIPLFIYYLADRVHFKELKIVKGVKRISEIQPKILISVLAFIFCFTFIAISFSQHKAFETRAFDVGIFAQAVWNTLQGDFLYSSLKNGICLLGDHFSPILLLTAPFYWIWPDPRTLFILQAIATSINIFFVYKIAHLKTKRVGISLLFAFLYTCYKATRGPLREDFHPEVIAEPFAFAAFLYLERRQILPFLISALFLIMGKENMLGISFILGFYAFTFKKMRAIGLGVMVFSVFIFMAELKWWMPALTGKPYFYQAFYQEPSNFLLNRVFTLDSINYLLEIFGPFGFLSFFHIPTLILTFPILFQNLLSHGETFRSVSYHYVTGLTPFVVISSIYGFDYLRSQFSMVKKNTSFILSALTLVFFLQSGVSDYYYWWRTQNNFSKNKAIYHQQLSKIPSQHSVLTHNHVIPHVVNRKNVFQFNYNPKPNKVEEAVILKPDYIVMGREFWEPNTEAIEPMLKGLLKLGYRIEYQKGDFYILKSQNAS